LCKPHLQEIGAAGEMEGAGLWGTAGTLRQQVGEICRGEHLRDPGVLQRPGPGLRRREVTPGPDRADVMGRLEAPLLQRAIRRLRLGGAREQASAARRSAGVFPLLQERFGVSGRVAILAPVVLSRMASHAGVPQRDTQTIGGGCAREGWAGIVGRNRRALGCEGQTTRPGGTPLGHGGASKRRQREGAQRRPFLVPSRGGGGPGFAGPTPSGHRRQPRPRGRMAGVKVGDLQAREARLFALAYASFHAALFSALAPMAWGQGNAGVGGQVARRGREPGGFASRALEPGGLQGLDPHWGGHAATALPGVLMTGQAVRQGLGDGACHRPPTAGAQDHDQDAQPSWCWPHRDGATQAPSALGPRAGGPGQGEHGGLPSGADGASRRFAQGRAAGQALLTQALADLGSRRGLALQPRDHRRCARIAWAGGRSWRAGAEGFLGQPGGHRARIEPQCLRTLRGVPPLGRMPLFARTAAGRVDHDPTAQRRANTAFRSTGASSAAPVEALGVAPWGSASRAKTWESGG